jgi:hypothetical protein
MLQAAVCAGPGSRDAPKIKLIGDLDVAALSHWAAVHFAWPGYKAVLRSDMPYRVRGGRVIGSGGRNHAIDRRARGDPLSSDHRHGRSKVHHASRIALAHRPQRLPSMTCRPDRTEQPAIQHQPATIATTSSKTSEWRATSSYGFFPAGGDVRPHSSGYESPSVLSAPADLGERFAARDELAE